MAKREREGPALGEFGWVSAEEAARQLGVSINVVYDRINVKPGAWRKVDGRWRVDAEALRRLLELEQGWYDRVHASHVEVPARPTAPSDARPEPNWGAMGAWLTAVQAGEVLGLKVHQVGVLGKRGTIERRERPVKVARGQHWRKGPLMRWIRFWYRTEDVRRYWRLQEKKSRDRALRGESNHHWGARDRRDIVDPAWDETVDTATAAEWLGVSRSRVAVLCRQGKLPARQACPGRSGSPLRIPAYAVLALEERPDRLYWRAIRETTLNEEEPDPGLYGVDARRADRERRERLIEERREIAYRFDHESDRVYTLRTEDWEPEEGARREAGFGHYEWTSTREPFDVVYCSPARREFGEREVAHGDFYSTAQAARYLGVCRQRVLDLRQRGRLRGYHLRKEKERPGLRPRYWFFLKEEVEEELERLKRRRRGRRVKRAGR